MNNENDSGKYLLESIRLAMGNVKGRQPTWPFGAVLVRDGQVWRAPSTRSMSSATPRPTPRCRPCA
jgi:hypothetical protein